MEIRVCSIHEPCSHVRDAIKEGDKNCIYDYVEKNFKNHLALKNNITRVEAFWGSDGSSFLLKLWSYRVKLGHKELNFLCRNI